MTSIIKPETFTATATQPDHGFWIEGTVEVTLRGETRTVKAHKSSRTAEITAFGMTGRYLTGSKAWPASVTAGKNCDHVYFGRDDRSGKFQKINCLHFA